MMANLKMSICQYPLTIFLVDDNQAFLTDVELNLGVQNIMCRSEHNPKEALVFLNETYKADPFTARCMPVPEDRDIDSFVSHFDFRKIHHEIYYPARFSQIGILIADYVMPMMGGIDFLNRVEENYCQKMLLTGEASQQLAIDAFNKGVINKFIEKGDSNLSALLVQGIKELQQKYFLNLSEYALSKASPELYHQAPLCLTDAIFIKFFEEICKRYNIVEYYLLDEHGSFLLLNAKGVPSWLIVKSEKDLKNIVEFAEDQNPPPEVMRALKDKTHVPYFHTAEDWTVGYNDSRCWKYLHPAEKLEGEKTNYFVAYLDNPDAYELDREKILSFEKYFKNA